IMEAHYPSLIECPSRKVLLINRGVPPDLRGQDLRGDLRGRDLRGDLRVLFVLVVVILLSWQGRQGHRLVEFAIT
ncbi:MAG: hypothetical protein K8R91_03800, partial [Phycisphaerae bacterium]|nr:hypothetical protein [Phycisphaerae bacterium]